MRELVVAHGEKGTVVTCFLCPPPPCLSTELNHAWLLLTTRAFLHSLLGLQIPNSNSLRKDIIEAIIENTNRAVEKSVLSQAC